ncbi:MAG: hypothetical protein ABIK09_17085 [Pseudomonadota bacterium]
MMAQKSKKKKKKKNSSARTAWVIIVALAGLGSVGAWVLWNHGGYETFTAWFYGEKGTPEAVVEGDPGKDGVPPRRSPPPDPLWDGAEGRAVRTAPGDLARAVAPEGVKRTAITLKQAGRLVSSLVGGELQAVRGAKTEGRYLFEVVGGDRFLPFDTEPVFVEVGHHVLEGPFGSGAADAFVVPMAVEDPEGPQWQSRYVGVVAWRGRPDEPGPRLGSAALQAPGGWFVRTEALDAEGNGAAEILLEVEYNGPQGLVMREASVWFLGTTHSQKMWNGMTLDDAPGLGAAVAKAWDVEIVPARDGRGADLEVTERRRTYEVGRDLDRSVKQDEVVGRTTVRLPKGRRTR